MEQVSKYAFRLACARYFSQELLTNLSPSLNKLPNVCKAELSTLLKDEQCCESCQHSCVSCKDNCVNKPDCFKLPCDNCGLITKDCNSEEVKAVVQIFQAISKINISNCEKFVVEEKRFENFPNCKLFAEIFDNYFDTAIGSFSSYLLKKKMIDEDTHKDNLMYSRMIHRLPAKKLRYVYHEVNFNNNVDEEELRKQPHQAGKKNRKHRVVHRN